MQINDTGNLTGRKKRILQNTRLLALSASIVPVLVLNTAKAAEIEEMVITGARIEESIPQDLSRYGSRVEVITAEEIARHGFIDVTQTLQMLVPGLHIRPKNGQFDYFDASLQGSRNEDILWLIDGVRITNRLYNGTSPLDTIPAHMIERIEVLKGGQGIFYGTQSVGGVVNVITKSFQETSDGAVGVGLSSNNGYKLNAYYRGGNDTHQFVAYASKDEADGYQPFRDSQLQASATDRERGYDVNMLGLKYAWNINADSRLSVQYQLTENELDFLRPFINFSTVNERDEDILTLKYDLQLTDNVGFFVKAYQHNWDTDYTRIYNTLDAGGMVTGVLDVRNDASFWGYEDYGFNAMTKVNSRHGLEYVVGLDHQNFSGQDEVWRIGDQEEEVNAVFVQVRTNEQLLENTALAIGVRSNDASNADVSNVWNLSGKHTFSDSLYINANIGTSFRLPDAEALFLNEYYDDDNDGIPDDGYFALGNPDLKPEKSRNINVGVGGLISGLSFELIAFRRSITDYIDSYVPLTIGGVVGESFTNSSDEVKVNGYELITAYTLTESLGINFSYNRTKSELNNSGSQLRGIPENEIKIALNYNNQRLPFGASLNLNRVGNFNARQGVIRGDYIVADLSAYYNLGRAQNHQFVARIENLGDVVYATRVDSAVMDSGGSYIYDNLGVERTLHLGYSYHF